MVDAERGALDAAARTLHAVSPVRVLDRGFTLTLTADGRPLTSSADVAPGALLQTVLPDGRVASRVLDVETSDTQTDATKPRTPATPIKPRGKRQRPARTPPAPPPGLFE